MQFLAASSSGGMSDGFIVVNFVIFIGVMYFVAIRPQKKEQKKHDELLKQVEIGDSVLTTSGFYGTVIDITDDTVIVEFGSNKNCRIPMKKAAISEVEKAGSANTVK